MSLAVARARRAACLLTALGLAGCAVATPPAAPSAPVARQALVERELEVMRVDRDRQGAYAPPVATILGPLRLVRPLARETLARAVAEAESLYRSRRFADALNAYQTIVEVDPANPHGWLRLGNLHQQGGRDVDALEAYRQASLAPRAGSADAQARGKALVNLALLSIAQAERAIDELDALSPGSVGDAREEAAVQVEAVRSRAQRAAVRDPGTVAVTPAVAVAAPARGSPGERGPGPGGAGGAVAGAASGAAPRAAGGAASGAPADTAVGAAATSPYTVDRWIAKPRVAPPPRAAGRGSLTEPVTESPLPGPPSVEMLRGGVRGVRP